MADKIVSWGGVDSKGATGMGVTGSLAVSGSATITNGATVYNNIVINTSNAPALDLYDSLQNYTWRIFTNGASFFIRDDGGNNAFSITTSRNITIGPGTSNAARLTVKGSGTTSSTTALLVQNANASASFTVKDDRSATFAKELYIDGDLGDGTGSIFLKNSAGDYSNRIGTYGYNTFISTRGTANGIQFLFGIGSSRALNFTGGDPNNIAIQPAGASLSINSVNDIVHGSDLIKIESRNYNGGEGVIITRGRSTNLTDPIVTFKYETAEKVRINNSGNVGIGTSTPTASLHISGSSGSVLLEVDSPAVNNILFVSGSGNVGIGTGTPLYPLDVRSSTQNTTLSIQNSGSAGLGTSTAALRFANADSYSSTFTLSNSGITLATHGGSSPFNVIGSLAVGSISGAKLAVKGDGTTSSTTAFQVQNANASASFTITDNLNATFAGVISGPNSYTLGTTSSNTPVLSISGYFIGTGAITTTNSNARSFNTIIGGQGSGIISQYNGVAQGQTNNNEYFLAGGNINLTDGAIDLRGFSFAPTIVSETGSAIKAFWSGLSAASNRYNLFLSGSAQNYIAGNVGIGTLSPSASLHISGSSNSALLEIDSPAVNNILYVSGSGNVGIGTGTPARTLEVNGTIGTSADGLGRGITMGTAVVGGSSYLNVGQGTGWIFHLTTNNATYTANSTRMSITDNGVGFGNFIANGGTVSATAHIRGSGTTSSTTALLVQNANASASLSVKDDGSVGIGTASPFSSGLTVANPAYTGYGRVYMNANNTFIVADAGTGGNITFGPSNRIFINSQQVSLPSGYISIGGSATISTSGSYQGTTFSLGNFIAANIGGSTGLTISSKYTQQGAGGPNTGTVVRIIDTGIDTVTGVTNTLTMLSINPLVNTTGGSTTLRGIYYNPNMSSSVGLTQHTAIETTAGSVLFNGGNVGIGTSTPSSSLHISGASAVLTLSPQSPLPSGVPTGSFAVSSSAPPKPYFYDGTTWNALY
jgi:hypothetical protein